MKTTDKLKNYKTRERIEFVSGLINKLENLNDSIINSQQFNFSDVTESQENEFLKFVPVSIVSCFEEFFKLIISDYINKDEKYLSNVEKLTKKNSFQFNFELFRNLKSEEFTIGEFISFSLGYSDLKVIRKNIETIIDCDLITRLSNITTYELYDKSETNKELNESKKNVQTIYSNLIAVYRRRHIISHEFGAKHTILKSEASSMLSNAILFLKALDRMFIDDFYSNYAWTQREMNKQVAKEFRELECTLEKAIAEYNDFRKDKVNETQSMVKLWKNSVEKEATFYGNHYAEGGSLYPSLYYNRLNESYRKKIEEFEKLMAF